jgi:hypothetical protein
MVTFHWESWEYDPNLCCENLAEIADKYGIMCIYDNHQWECSSWIGCRVGMPNSLMSVNYKKHRNGVNNESSIIFATTPFSSTFQTDETTKEMILQYKIDLINCPGLDQVVNSSF